MRYQDVVLLAIEILKEIGIDCKEHKKVLIYSPSQKNIKDTINAYIDNLSTNETRSTDFINDEANGFYRRIENKDGTVSFIITISNKLNDCWARLVETKELAHIIIDRKSKNHVKNLDELIESLIENPPTIRFDDDIPSEYITFFFAVELLLPYCMNDYIINHDQSSFEAAKMFMVPEKTVDMVRTSWYQELRRNAYEGL